MAIKNLRCIREGDSIAVVWVWDMGREEQACITVTRLLDGEEVAAMKVGQALYQQAVNTPRHGPLLKAPQVPLRVTVGDSDNEASYELIDKQYTVEWRLNRQNVYRRRGFLGGQALVRTDVCLQLKFPYEGQVPDDLFYYILISPGEQAERTAPDGYLPELHYGINEYGVIPPVGKTIQLCCKPKHQAAVRLFNFKRLPDGVQ